MPRYLAVYTGTASTRAQSGWDDLDHAERERRQQQGMLGWRQWMLTHAAVLVDAGGPLGATKRVTRQGVADISNELVGYVLVEAESLPAAAGLFENHPHFTIFPGDDVEVMECLPMPGQ